MRYESVECANPQVSFFKNYGMGVKGLLPFTVYDVTKREIFSACFNFTFLGHSHRKIKGKNSRIFTINMA